MCCHIYTSFQVFAYSENLNFKVDGVENGCYVVSILPCLHLLPKGVSDIQYSQSGDCADSVFKEPLRLG